MCYLVGDEYRTNKMSLIPGGSIVTVIYNSGECRIYDKVKRPFAYLKTINTSKIASINIDGKEYLTDEKIS